MKPPIDSAQADDVSAPSKLAMNLKSQLKFLLSRRGMTPAELARKSGVSKQVLSLWLGGAKPKNVEQIKSVADALNVSVDCLLFGDGDERELKNVSGLDALLGDDWISGAFEIKIRRIKKGGK